MPTPSGAEDHTTLAVELRDAGILVNSVDPGQFASHPELGDDNDGRPTVESARWVAWAAMLPAGRATVAPCRHLSRLPSLPARWPRWRNLRLSYWVLPSARGRRVAPRALDALTVWCFGTLGLHRMELNHSTMNGASCRVAQRSGFAIEGTKRSQCRHADGWHDMHLHARLSSDQLSPSSGATAAATAG